MWGSASFGFDFKGCFKLLMKVKPLLSNVSCQEGTRREFCLPAGEGKIHFQHLDVLQRHGAEPSVIN